MDRIYDAAQQGLLACLTDAHQERNLSRFLTHLLADAAWSTEDVLHVEHEVRRLLSLSATEPPPLLPLRAPRETIDGAQASRTG